MGLTHSCWPPKPLHLPKNLPLVPKPTSKLPGKLPDNLSARGAQCCCTGDRPLGGIVPWRGGDSRAAPNAATSQPFGEGWRIGDTLPTHPRLGAAPGVKGKHPQLGHPRGMGAPEVLPAGNAPRAGNVSQSRGLGHPHCRHGAIPQHPARIREQGPHIPAQPCSSQCSEWIRCWWETWHGLSCSGIILNPHRDAGHGTGRDAPGKLAGRRPLTLAPRDSCLTGFMEQALLPGWCWAHTRRGGTGDPSVPAGSGSYLSSKYGFSLNKGEE